MTIKIDLWERFWEKDVFKNQEDPLKLIPPPETYVGVPPAVAFLAEVDLSTHVETVAPEEGAVPVPAGSLPSSQRARLPTLVGKKLAEAKETLVIDKFGISYKKRI
jgi:hypothetical protein